MGDGNIKEKDLEFLRRESFDRDSWAGVRVLYYKLGVVDIDRVRKEPQTIVLETDPIPIRGFIQVQKPSAPHSSRPSGDAPGPEHELRLKISVESLKEHGIEPKSRDQIEIQEVRYEVRFKVKDGFPSETPFNIDVEIPLVRLETADNAMDQPFEAVARRL